MTLNQDGVVQFEWEMMLERQRDGVARTKAAGNYKRHKRIAPEQRTEVVRLAGLELPKAGIARKLGLGEACAYQILAETKKLSTHETTHVDLSLKRTQDIDRTDGAFYSYVVTTRYF